MKETKIKHFFEYLDYENIVSEDYSFELPSKNDKGIFITNLSKPFAFYLPKSELCDMFQDVYGNNVINYIINLDCHSEIVQFLENFDTLCINNASDNSKKWFGKELNSEKLIKYYNTLYELSEDEKTLYLPIAIGTEHIEEIIRYNENSDLILSVKITGIEFFQQTFRWRIEFNSIVESVEESEEDEDVNFDNMVQTSNNLESSTGMKHSSDEYIVNTDKKDDEYIEEHEEQYIDNYHEDVDQEQAEYTEELQEYLDYQENEDLIAGREIQLDNSDEYENYYEQSEEEYRDEEEYEHDENRNHEEEYEHDENECHRESDEDPHDSEEHQYYEDDEQSYYEENPQEDENQELYEEENQEEYYEEEQPSEEDEHYFREEEQQSQEEEQQSQEEEQQSREEEQQLREEDEQSREDEQRSREDEQQSREDEQQSREEDKQSKEEEDVDENKSTEQKLEESRNDIEKNEESHNEEMEDTKLNPSMIEDLAEETTIKNDNNLSNDTIQEITSIISEKRLEAKKYTINATRAKRALDTLSLKADEVNREIELYENKLRACQS